MILLQHHTAPHYVVQDPDGTTVLIKTDEEELIPLSAAGVETLMASDAWDDYTGTPALARALEAMVAEDDPVALIDDIEAFIEVISLPDISDVSYPSMVGAIDPSKPKRKGKRKKVRYKGVMLGRRPTDFEAHVLSLTTIPRRYDAELTRVVDELATVRRAHLAALLADPARDAAFEAQTRERTEGILAAAQERMARYGVFELRNECRRQGLHLEDVPEGNPAFDTIADTPVLKASVRLMAETLHREWLGLLDRTTIRLTRTKRGRDQFFRLAEPQILWGLKTVARHLLHEAYGVPRAAYMQAIVAAAEPAGTFALAKARTVDDDEAEDLVDYVLQSAVMDTLTCDPCALADGLTFDYGDDEMEYHEPPYVECLGGENCRCVQIYVLKGGGYWIVREDQILRGGRKAPPRKRP